VKRVLITAAAVILPLLLLVSPVSIAGATGGHPPANSVQIQERVQYDINGDIIHVGLVVTCRSSSPAGLPGQVAVSAEQAPPETTYPVATGVGVQSVVCDGRPHSVAVTLYGVGFDAGRARVNVELIPALGGGNGVRTNRYVTIVAA
jgi:hypothetical protein